MATIKNTADQNVIIAGQLLKPQGTVEYNGKIPRSLRILQKLNALEITGDDGDVDDDDVIVNKVGKAVNHEPINVNPPSKKEVAAENDKKIVDVMLALPKEAMMADGRPEVRSVNAELAKVGMNNITAEDRDRIWALAQSQEPKAD